MDFSGKVVIVTGAGSGIGAASALLFTREGAHLALVDRDGDSLNNVAQECTQQGSTPLTIKADITNEQETRAVVEKTVQHFGKLDVLINSAGIVRFNATTDPNLLEIFDEVMKINLRPIVQLTSLALPHLMRTKGNIVNVSSIAGLKVVENYVCYSVAKAGLVQFTLCAALDLAASGVRVNCVNPGPVRTKLLENAGMSQADGDALWKRAAVATALGRISEPEEVADVIAFLASDKARGITGSTYVVDNGLMLK